MTFILLLMLTYIYIYRLFNQLSLYFGDIFIYRFIKRPFSVFSRSEAVDPVTVTSNYIFNDASCEDPNFKGAPHKVTAAGVPPSGQRSRPSLSKSRLSTRLLIGTRANAVVRMKSYILLCISFICCNISVFFLRIDNQYRFTTSVPTVWSSELCDSIYYKRYLITLSPLHIHSETNSNYHMTDWVFRNY